MWEFIDGFCQAITFAIVGTLMGIITLGVVYVAFGWLGWVCDGIREWSIYWWAVMALSMLPRDSKLAKDIRCKHDLHDYCDGSPYEPCHFYTYHCDRCGKTFVI